MMPTRPVPLKNTRMNKTEQAYAAYLEDMKHKGDIVAYRFEPFGIRLAGRTFYHPDFLVVFHTHIEVHEVKGFWRDDARVKFKVAADLHPWFRFVAVYKTKQGFRLDPA